ncbi:restriction endonuclease subunit S [Streptococcus hohhotensis]|jgi:restriction endonuclease S subunit|uniref:restriction endonuclease subunit S n=1 Tax=Streptococcus sp. 20925_1_24 TaxID=3003662 RepID=UPI0021B81A5B
MKLKENDNVPEIRFDSFKEEWDKKRFKDFTKLSQGLQIAISSRFLEDGEHRYFYITNEFLNPNSTKKYYIESPSENVICTVDDILMTRTGNTGKVITNISGAFHNNFFKVDYDKFETSKMFLYYLLTSNDIQKEIIIRAGNSTIPDLNHSDFYSIKTSVPALDEQTAIGALFRTLDDLLARYKDNLTNYQSLKATMLSKMFPKDGQTVPEIRLDGFEEEWGKDTLEPYLTESRISGDTGLTAKKITVKLWGKGVIEKEEKYAGSSNTQYFIRKGGQFIYSKLDFQNQAFGIIPNELNGYQSTLDLPTFDIQNIDSKFLLEYVMRREFYEYQGLIANGSRKAKRIHPEDFLVMPVRIPSIEEQQAIGAYFSNLDNLINSHQEKISQLEILKKKLLQDMFI